MYAHQKETRIDCVPTSYEHFRCAGAVESNMRIIPSGFAARLPLKMGLLIWCPVD